MRHKFTFAAVVLSRTSSENARRSTKLHHSIVEIGFESFGSVAVDRVHCVRVHDGNVVRCNPNDLP